MQQIARNTIIAFVISGIYATAAAQTGGHYSLQFNAAAYTTQNLTANGRTFTVRAYEHIVYVANPVDTAYQVMNIYIPEDYFNGKSVNGYTAATAPIFFPNSIGGYMPGKPASTTNNGFGGGFVGGPGGARPAGMPPPPGGNNGPGGFGGRPQGPSAVVFALSKGYVVASAGARGRTSKDAEGTYTGKAPADIVDLKAAVRYLKYNDANMPGDANKIIANGTSAGGAMSVLLGGTGNSADYATYLQALGAANATDDVFAVSAYCPIINLDNADMAYEWQFNGVNNYQQMGFGPSSNNGPSVLTDAQVKVSGDLKALFPAYVNSLKLVDKTGQPLTLDNGGNGSFKEWVKQWVMASAQHAIDAGADLSQHAWLTITNGKVTGIDFDGYVQYMQRMKTPPAFDALDLTTPETQLFGTATVDKQHFTQYAAAHSSVAATTADKLAVKMMNPMYYIAQQGTKTAQHWHIRHGTKDKDTGLAIPVILATYLLNKGYDINFALPWDRPHSGDYDLDELFAWSDGICKQTK